MSPRLLLTFGKLSLQTALIANSVLLSFRHVPKFSLPLPAHRLP